MALLGGVLGIAGKAALSDRRAKADIDIVGALMDGTPVYSYHYKADPTKLKQIGPMAQDVKKRRPGRGGEAFLTVISRLTTARPLHSRAR